MDIENDNFWLLLQKHAIQEILADKEESKPSLLLKTICFRIENLDVVLSDVTKIRMSLYRTCKKERWFQPFIDTIFSFALQ